jgi:beta-glucosidase-like glycosyl hydrolase
MSGAYAALDDSEFQVVTRWVDSLQVGGLLVSGGSPFDIAAKLNALQLRSRLPLLVSADLEWGAGMRLNGGISYPMVMAAGATADPRDAYAIGAAAATEGRAVGIHVNFAPDADLNNNPLNPIINVRSFGENPAAVARLVEAYVHGLQEHGMLATLKHFPGHGDTRVDSHLTLPIITANYSRLDSVELIPFRAGIAAGASIVMSGHIAFPAFTG